MLWIYVLRSRYFRLCGDECGCVLAQAASEEPTIAKLAPATPFTNSLRVGPRLFSLLFLADLLFEIAALFFSISSIRFSWMLSQAAHRSRHAKIMVGPLYHSTKENVKKFQALNLWRKAVVGQFIVELIRTDAARAA